MMTKEGVASPIKPQGRLMTFCVTNKKVTEAYQSWRTQYKRNSQFLQINNINLAFNAANFVNWKQALKQIGNCNGKVVFFDDYNKNNYS